jgi:DNA-binding NtrC family response regulator
MRILILGHDPLRGELTDIVRRAFPAIDICQPRGTADASRAVEEEGPELVVIGAGAGAQPTIEIVRALRTGYPEMPVLVVSRQDDAAPAVAAMKAGASDYLVLRDGASGEDLRRMVLCLVRGTEGGRRRPALSSARPAGDALAGLVGRSPAMEQVKKLVRTAAQTEAHVLIEGETGTGKEVVARAVHALGRRAGGPFVPVNCAAVPDTLAESEFFGHARGAFTGALQDRPGMLHLAERGTLFLDEVEDLSPALQAKLLRVVQDREVRPLGGRTLRRVDVRILSAANRDLGRMVEAGAFRRDLYYRLRVFAIHLPPLRERREDLPLLIEHFVVGFNQTHGAAFAVPPAAVLRPLLEHSWPGNVRELENTLESLLVVAGATGAALADLLGQRHGSTAPFVLDERARILRVLDEHRWNRQRAAAALGISRVTLWRRMERHGIRDPLDTPASETA